MLSWSFRRPRSSAGGVRPAVDRLERRVLLAGDVVINELMAVNTRTLADADGDFSDWIELRNVSATPVNLGGWHLSDTRALPGQWTFPDVELAPGAHLLVFASEKDRAVAGAQLHTNFKLSSDGEYLALVRPDLTVEHAYDPYPEQKPDKSFGIGAPSRQTTRFVGTAAPGKFQLPADNTLGDTWTGVGFDDTSWSPATTGVGYEVTTGTQRPLPDELEPNDSTAAASDAGANFGPYADGLFHFTMKGAVGPNDLDFIQIGALEEGDLLTVSVSGSASYRATLPDPAVELYRAGSGERVTFDANSGPGPDALIHRFRVPANDTYYVRASAVNGTMTGTYELGAFVENAPGTPAPLTGGSAADAEPNETVATAGNASAAWRAVQHRSVTAGAITPATDADYIKFRFNAGDVITVVADSTSELEARVSLLGSTGTIPIAFDDGSLFGTPPFASDAFDARVNAFAIPSTGTYYVRVQSDGATSGSYRLEVNLSTFAPPPQAAWFSGLIGTNVQAAMLGSRPTAMVRMPFEATEEQLADVDQLLLSVRYDDGFVAYLNGTEVARRNAPGAPGTPISFDAVATADRDNAASVASEEIDLSAWKHLLVAGPNVLAVRGLNASAGDDDFLVAPELRAVTAPMETPPGFFTRATPGQLNGPIDSLGIVADTAFSHNRGFYDAPFDLVITTATPGAQIRYTTNGIAPTATTGTVYTGPVRISQTTTVRAAAFKAGYLPTNTDTQTYLFVDDVIRQSPNGQPMPGWPTSWGQNVRDYGMDPDVVNHIQYRDSIKNDLKSIPSFSIVMKLDDLFGSTGGIYANPRMDGRAWERPASLELIYPDGTKGFQSEIGLRIRGGFSRSTNNPKHGFRVFYRAEYGDADLNFPLFGPDGTQSSDGFDLRTFNNYSWSFGGNANGLFTRDVVSRDLQLNTGHNGERGDYYHLYINGVYWGIYNSAERAEASYGANYFGGTEEDYDVVKADNDAGNQVRATDGNLTAWTDLYNILRSGATVSEATYQRVQGKDPAGNDDPNIPVLLDVDNLIDYMLVIFYGGNLDSPVSQFINNNAGINNFFAMRNRNPEARQGFKFFVHDAEHTFLNVAEDRTGPFPAGSTLATSNPHYFFSRLATNPEFRIRVADRIHKHFFNGGALSAEKVMETFLRRKNELDRAVVAESARWGDSKVPVPRTRNVDWLAEVNRVITSYIPSRGTNVLAQLRGDALWPVVGPVIFGKHGGSVAPGYELTMRPTSAPAEFTIYYTLDGTDPRLPGGGLSPSAVAYTNVPLTINEAVTVRARVRQGTTWSALTEASFSVDTVPLRVTEVMYHPAPPPEGSPFTRSDFEFVEVQNAGTTPLDLAGLAFDRGIQFAFPAITLAPGELAVVARNIAAFTSRYGDAVLPIGEFFGGLDNAGDRLRGVDTDNGGATVLDFAYSDQWQPRTDGDGYSLVPRDPAAPADAWEIPGRWRASRVAGGTPGQADLAPLETVAGRWLFHNRSPFDGTQLSGDSSDDNAMARDVRALLPGGRATSANLSNSTRGINGLMIDLANIAYGSVPTAADFVFRVGSGGDPATWPLAPAPTIGRFRRGGGAGGSDRITLTWADGAIRNQWLQVTVLANGRTGLSSPDVFYFGHLDGEMGPARLGAAAAVVGSQDIAAVRAHVSSRPANASNRYDLNHDGKVTARDVLLVRAASGKSLALFTAPPAAAAAGAPRTAFSETPVTTTARSAPTRRQVLDLASAGGINL